MRFAPTSGATTAKTRIGQQAKGGLQTAAPFRFHIRVTEARHSPEPGTAFEFHTRGGVCLTTTAGKTIHRSAYASRSTKWAGARPVAPQQAAAFRIGQPLIGEYRLSREKGIDQAQRYETRRAPANLSKKGRVRRGK